jgi:hypothetical protein
LSPASVANFRLLSSTLLPSLASTLRDTQAPPPIRNTNPTPRTNIVESLLPANHVRATNIDLVVLC